MSEYEGRGNIVYTTHLIARSPLLLFHFYLNLPKRWQLRHVKFGFSMKFWWKRSIFQLRCIFVRVELFISLFRLDYFSSSSRTSPSKQQIYPDKNTPKLENTSFSSKFYGESEFHMPQLPSLGQIEIIPWVIHWRIQTFLPLGLCTYLI